MTVRVLQLAARTWIRIRAATDGNESNRAGIPFLDFLLRNTSPVPMNEVVAALQGSAMTRVIREHGADAAILPLYDQRR